MAWVLRGALGSHGADDIGLDLWQVSLGLSDLSLVGILLILVHLTIEAVRRTPFALAILAAFFFLAVGGVNDILHAQQRIDTAFIAPYTFIAFVLVQAGLIAQKFAYAFEREMPVSGRSWRVMSSLMKSS